MAGAGLHHGGQRRCALYFPAHRVGVDDGPDFYGAWSISPRGIAVRPGVQAEQIEGSTPLELTWSIIPLFVFLAIFRLGRGDLLQGPHASPRFDRSLRGREAVDVEAGTCRGPARDQRTARAGGPRREADHDFAGRDPQLLRSRVPHEAGRACRAAIRWPGSAPPSPASITCSAPSIAARSTRA